MSHWTWRWTCHWAWSVLMSIEGNRFFLFQNTYMITIKPLRALKVIIVYRFADRCSPTGHRRARARSKNCKKHCLGAIYLYPTVMRQGWRGVSKPGSRTRSARGVSGLVPVHFYAGAHTYAAKLPGQLRGWVCEPNNHHHFHILYCVILRTHAHKSSLHSISSAQTQFAMHFARTKRVSNAFHAHKRYLQCISRAQKQFTNHFTCTKRACNSFHNILHVRQMGFIMFFTAACSAYRCI